MFRIKRSSERGKTHIDWLESYHSFSFGEYYDPANIHFGPLRVMNDDRVAPAGGFPYHQHRDMEIITYVMDGALEHKDSTGTNEVIRSNDVQKMSAGRGIMHSEFNHSKKEPVHFFQIWIIPDRKGLEPAYEQLHFTKEMRENKMLKVATNKGDDNTIYVSQDVEMFISNLKSGKSLNVDVESGRSIYLHVAEGKITVDGNVLSTGDAVEITSESSFQISADQESELIMFDLKQ